MIACIIISELKAYSLHFNKISQIVFYDFVCVCSVCFSCNLNTERQPLLYTGMFTSTYDCAWKGQNVSLSGGLPRIIWGEMVGFHSGEVERREGVRGC